MRLFRDRNLKGFAGFDLRQHHLQQAVFKFRRDLGILNPALQLERATELAVGTFVAMTKLVALAALALSLAG